MKKIVELHHGFISIKGLENGSGTVLEIGLPRA